MCLFLYTFFFVCTAGKWIFGCHENANCSFMADVYIEVRVIMVEKSLL